MTEFIVIEWKIPAVIKCMLSINIFSIKMFSRVKVFKDLAFKKFISSSVKLLNKEFDKLA